MDDIVILATPMKGEIKPVSLSFYSDENSERIIATNKMGSPFSPLSGEIMSRHSVAVVAAQAKEIRNELHQVGCCSSCSINLMASANFANEIVAYNDDEDNEPFQLFCVNCGDESDVTIDEPVEEDNFEHVEAAPIKTREELKTGGMKDALDRMVSGGKHTTMVDQTEDGDGDDLHDTLDGVMGDDENMDDDDMHDNPAVVAFDDDEDNTSDDDDSDTEIEAMEESDEPDPNEEEGSDTGDENDVEEPEGEDSDGDDDDSDEEFDPDNMGEGDEPKGKEDDMKNRNNVQANEITVSVDAYETLASVIDTDFRLAPIDNETAMVLSYDVDAGYSPILILDSRKAHEVNRSLFAKPEALAKAFNAVMASVDNKPTAANMKAFGAKPISFNVNVNNIVKERITAGINAATISLEDEKTQILADVEQSLSIAGLQVFKNLKQSAPNPLRAGLITALEANGVRNPEGMIDAAFATHGEQLLRTLLTQAKENFAKPLAVRNAIAEEAADATIRPVVAETKVENRSDKISRELANPVLPTLASPIEESPDRVVNIFASAVAAARLKTRTRIAS